MAVLIVTDYESKRIEEAAMILDNCFRAEEYKDSEIVIHTRSSQPHPVFEVSGPEEVMARVAERLLFDDYLVEVEE